MINFDAPPLRDVIEILIRGLKIDSLADVKPRAQKSDAEKILRTRSIAEVFTPSHVVKFMVDAIDDGNIDSRWLEIACGEAPFITNRYDADSGEAVPFELRAGVLDKKLRNVPAGVDKFIWARRAVQSVYGCELQADSLLIARANVLLTVAEFVGDCTVDELTETAEVIAENFWQTDILKPPSRQISLFEDATDWNSGDSFLLGGNTMKKFDFVIGNPPYHEETDNNSTRKLPVYGKFMEAAYKVGKQVELITPAKFLSNAGDTSKDFNQRMLNDPHLKVLDYAPDSDKYFKGVEIKGGVAITLHDEDRDFGAIGTFIAFDELKTIHQKVCIDNPSFRPLNEIIYPRAIYRFVEDNSFVDTNAFEKMSDCFFDDKPDDGNEYIKIFGLLKNQRTYKWIRRDAVTNHETLDKHKVFVPQANGAGTFGEVLSNPVVGEPFVGNTATFTVVGAFDTAEEAEACLAYVKSKFARTMLGVLKVTQHNPPATWAKVPLQDFTATSDIVWNASVREIDAQLYRKYGLDDAEVAFIETHVKEMS